MLSWLTGHSIATSIAKIWFSWWNKVWILTNIWIASRAIGSSCHRIRVTTRPSKPRHKSNQCNPWRKSPIIRPLNSLLMSFKVTTVPRRGTARTNSRRSKIRSSHSPWRRRNSDCCNNASMVKKWLSKASRQINCRPPSGSRDRCKMLLASRAHLPTPTIQCILFGPILLWVRTLRC